ncbi:MAG: DJ-1/PfpI family protein [Lachnospiraceae bacterium]|nr:DJ-1/PfpI family protein [Lachnospiraceae bacterium]
MSKVAIFMATGFEEIEALTVVDLLRRAGISISMVSITGEIQVTSSHKVQVTCDALLEEVDFQGLDMIVLPGGMPGTKHLEACEPLMRQVEAFYQAGKYISAICAAPSILGHRGMLKGRTACSFPEFESHLEGADVTGSEVEVSDFIITARGMGCAIPFGLAIVERFLGKETAEALGKKIVYQQS